MVPIRSGVASRQFDGRAGAGMALWGGLVGMGVPFLATIGRHFPAAVHPNLCLLAQQPNLDDVLLILLAFFDAGEPLAQVLPAPKNVLLTRP
jgi:hypothetical protein